LYEAAEVPLWVHAAPNFVELVTQAAEAWARECYQPA
jgi:hypothetical protein